MAEYAYVENNVPIEFYDLLPQNWRNISGLNKITDEQELNNLGWYRVTKNKISYNPDTQKETGFSYSFENGQVIETNIIEDLPPEETWTVERKRQYFLDGIRQSRNALLAESDWTQALDVNEIKSQEWKDAWRNYRQALRDLPAQYQTITDFGVNIEFPPKPEG